MGFEDNILYILITAMIAGFGTISAFFFAAKRSRQEAKEQAREEMQDFIQNTANKMIDLVEKKVDANSSAIEITKLSIANIVHNQETSMKGIEQRFDERGQWLKEGFDRLEGKVAMLQQVQWGGSSHSQPDWVAGRGNRVKDVIHDERPSSGTGIFSSEKQTRKEEKSSTNKAHRDENQRSEDADNEEDKAIVAKLTQEFVEQHPMGITHEIQELKEKIKELEKDRVVKEK